MFLLQMNESKRQANFSFQFTSSWFESFEPLEKRTSRINRHSLFKLKRALFHITCYRSFYGYAQFLPYSQKNNVMISRIFIIPVWNTFIEVFNEQTHSFHLSWTKYLWKINAFDIGKSFACTHRINRWSTNPGVS